MLYLLAQDIVSDQFTQMPKETVLIGYDSSLDGISIDIEAYLQQLFTWQALSQKVLEATLSIDVLTQQALDDDLRALLKYKAGQGVSIRVLGIQDPDFESRFIRGDFLVEPLLLIDGQEHIQGGLLANSSSRTYWMKSALAETNLHENFNYLWEDQ